MSNKKLGNDFESELCEMLRHNGFWAYNTVNKASGQPADIIAAKNSISVLIDAKVCSNDEFKLDRIESNQETAAMLYDKCGNSHCYFALKMSDGTVYLCSTLVLLMLRQHKSVLRRTDIEELGILLDEWFSKNNI